MIDDLIALRVRDAAGPSDPDPQFADALLSELADILGHEGDALPRRFVVLRPRRKGGRRRVLLIAAAAAALLIALLLALSAGRRPPMADVPLDGVDNARLGVQPGPGPHEMPAEAWSLPVGPVAFTPVIEDGVLYFGARDGRLRAVDAATGTERWSFTASDEIEGAAAVGEGLVMFPDVSAALFGVDAETGLPRWRGAQDLFQGASPALVDGSLYLGGGDGRMHVLDSRTGGERWSIGAGGPVTAVTVVDGQVYLGTIDGRLFAASVEARNLVWGPVKVGRGSIDRIAVDGDRVYAAVTDTAGPGLVAGVATGTGEVIWSFAPIDGTDLRLGALDGDRLFVTSTSGVTSLDRSTGTVRWHVPRPATKQGLVLSDGILYVAADPAALVALDAGTGSERWSIGLAPDPSPPSLAWYPQRGLPVVSGGFVFIGDGVGLHAFADPSVAAPPPVSRVSPSAPRPSFPNPVAALRQVPSPDRGLKHPSGMDVGPDGLLYVIEAGASRVTVIGPDGNLVRSWGERGRGDGQFDFRRDPTDPASDAGGVAVAPDGTVYVADTVNDRIQAFAPDGRFLFEWGESGSGNSEFLEPFDLDVCRDGRVLVVDDVRADIQVFDASGAYVDTVGQKGNGPGELMTSSVTCASDGTIVNADWANDRVQASDAAGVFLWSVNGAAEHEPPMRFPADVAVDEAGNVWVVDRTRLLVFDREQRLVAVWRPREHGLGRDPMSIALDGLGHAYIGFPFQDQVVQLTLRSDVLPRR